MAEADISKIINVIMENPSLIEEIRKTLSKSEESESIDTAQKAPESEAEEPTVKVEEMGRATYTKKSKRNDLLLAMRPYLSEERGKAIESMISVADILFALKEK
jgi:hypothetical protein